MHSEACVLSIHEDAGSAHFDDVQTARLGDEALADNAPSRSSIDQDALISSSTGALFPALVSTTCTSMWPPCLSAAISNLSDELDIAMSSIPNEIC